MTISETPLVYSWVRDLQIDEKYTYLLRDYAWCLSSDGRPVTGNLKRKDGSQKFDGFTSMIKLHQLIMYLESGKVSDRKAQVRHLNHDRLDNRLENLALGTARDNALDHEENTGVNQTHNGKWFAQAYLAGKIYGCTCRENQEDALRDYEKMVNDFELHGIIPKTLQERRDLPQYVSLTRKTKPYQITKRISGRTAHFGYYSTVEEAVEARDVLIANNWVK
jgi:hypothetical protein